MCESIISKTANTVHQPKHLGPIHPYQPVQLLRVIDSSGIVIYKIRLKRIKLNIL